MKFTEFCEDLLEPSSQSRIRAGKLRAITCNAILVRVDKLDVAIHEAQGSRILYMLSNVSEHLFHWVVNRAVGVDVDHRDALYILS